MVQRIDLYLLRKVIVPLGATAIIAALLLLLERMLRLFDFVINENGPVEVVWQMLANLVPHYLGLALPVGIFLGTLLAFRSLSLSSELDALMACGAGLPRLMRPILALALVLTILDIWLVGYLQPISRYEYRQLQFELRSGALGASIRVGEFVELTDEILLRVGDSRDQGRELLDIFLRRTSGVGEEISITARRGAFYATGDDQTVLLRLLDGRLVEFDPEYTKPRVLSFETQDLVIDLPQIEGFRQRGGEERELTLSELWRGMQPESGEEATLRRSFLAQFHWRLVHILTFLAVPFVAAPLGIANKRTGAAGSMVAGLALLIVYNELAEAGERQVALANATPLTGLWLLYMALAGTGAFLFYRAAFRPGRGVAGVIDRTAEAIMAPLRRGLSALLERIA